MPLDLGFLDHLVNVHWGGKAVFVLGTYKGKLYYCDPRSSNDITFEMVELPESGLFEDDRGFFYIAGTSYASVGADDAATPQFLVCGMASESSGLSPPNTPFRFYSFICISEDGRTWEQVYKGPMGETEDHGFIFPWASWSNALVWEPDEQAFYHSLTLSKTTGSEKYEHEQIFTSTDGRNWSGPISDRSVLFADNGAIFQSNFPDDYCSHNEGFDERDQHVPDGVMSTFGESKDIAMRPVTPPRMTYAGVNTTIYWPEVPAGRVEIITRDEEGAETTTPVAVSDIAHITAVGGSGSTWMAGGWNDENGDSGGIAFSFDDGETWVAGPAIDSGVVTLAWAPAADTAEE